MPFVGGGGGGGPEYGVNPEGGGGGGGIPDRWPQPPSCGRMGMAGMPGGGGGGAMAPKAGIPGGGPAKRPGGRGTLAGIALFFRA